MSRRSSDSEYRKSQLTIAAVYLLLVGLFAAATVKAETPETRESTTKQYTSGGRASTDEPVVTDDSFAALVTEGERKRSADISASSDGSPAVAKATANDFWIYAADVVLFGDDDVDGYFYGIDLLFDADTIYSSADVYAVLSLSLNGGPWNEYAATEDFLINDATSDDEYVMVTELRSGYPTGDYDLLIELFDANTGEFLTDFGPEDASDLSFLPLEDFNRDAPVVLDPPVTVSRGSGGGGSTGWLTLAVLLAFAGITMLRRDAARPRDDDLI